MTPDFSGYATKYGVKCSDGKTILAHAFKGQDGKKLPLVWQHQHHIPQNILGHAILEHRDDGVYVQGYFNESEAAKDVREQIRHGDINSLSIFANNLGFKGKDMVSHGSIKEVSVVIAGANPGAYIDQITHAYSDDYDTETQAVIYSGETLSHADSDDDDKSGDDDDMTIADVYNSMTEEQKKVNAFLITEALKAQKEDLEHSDESYEDEEEDEEESLEHDDTNDEGVKTLKHNHNVFEGNSHSTPQRPTLTHGQLEAIKNDFLKHGSFKEAVLEHAVEYGVEDIDLLFPDAKSLENAPELIGRNVGWVSSVLSATRKTPFSKVKTMWGDITHEEARAKGYIKGTLKKEEFFGLTKRETGPTTIYKKQKLDRDDIIDVTDFDLVAWLKAEMRLMLDEEIARAIVFGDGREVDDEDKIKDPASLSDGNGIRSIVNDHEFFAFQLNYPANAGGEARIEAVMRAMKDYRGSGSPTFYTSASEVTDLLLLKDRLGRRLYNSEQELARAMRVSSIVEVDDEVMPEGVVGVVANLRDYVVGTNRGGEVNFFSDFDIDYNQEKYLYETRLSGGLVKHRSALVIRRAEGTEVTPTAPSFDSATNTITIPSITGVEYLVNDVVETGDVVITEDSVVEARPIDDYYFRGNSTTVWEFNYTA